MILGCGLVGKTIADDLSENFYITVVDKDNEKLTAFKSTGGPDILQMDFEGIGTFEAFNTDGLRTLLRNLPVANMIEKTLRYPNTMQYIKMLRDCGFFSQSDIFLKNCKIKPLDLTAKLLFPKWTLKPGDEDITLMRIKMSGKEGGREKMILFELIDHYDRASETTSMARTTGYTCGAVTNLFLDKRIEKKGIIPMERIADNKGNYDFIMNYLGKRGVRYRKTLTDI